RGRNRVRAVGCGDRGRLRSPAGAGGDGGQGVGDARRAGRSAGRGGADRSGSMILVIDHYDSFVYNLVQLVEGLGHEAEVVRSDAEPADALAARKPDAVIL